MVLENELNTLIDAVKNLPIKEALAYLVVNKISNFSTEGYLFFKKIICNKYNESKYAFFPTKEEAVVLKTLGKRPEYIEVSIIVPKYKYLDLLRTGLLVDYYLRRNNETDKVRIKEIKLEICRRPNGRKLLKIVNLPATPFFLPILDYLRDLKKSGYPENLLEEKLDEVIDDWQDNSKFVENSESIETVIEFFKSHRTNNTEVFFIVGMKKSAKTIEKAIDKLTEVKFLESNYKYKLTKDEEGNQPRVYVIFYKEDLQ